MSSRLSVSSVLAVAGICTAMIGCKPKVEMTTSGDSTSAKMVVASSTGAASTDAMKAGMKRFYDEVINAKKLDVIDSLCAPGFVEHNPPPGAEPTVAGLKKAMGGMFVAFPDLHCTVDDVMVDGDKVIARSTMTGTWKGDMMGAPGKPNGKSFTITGIDIVRLNKDGKATEHWGNEDDMKMMMDLGMMGGTPSDGKDKGKKM